MAEDFKEYIESEEGRNSILNSLLSTAEDVGYAKMAIKIIDETSFNELTPAMWGTIVGCVGPLRRITEAVESATKGALRLLDDPEAHSVINRHLGVPKE